MKYILENDNIKIVTNTFGGELNNLMTKNDDVEFLWNGAEKYWKYHSPILFPIVGKVKDNKYSIDNKIYELPQHGLARTREFEMIKKDDKQITFELKWSNETLNIYPYKFSLKISYELLDNGVKVLYDVTNLDDKDIYFSIGAHPAFMCPIFNNETFEDYCLIFNVNENSSIIELDPNTGYLTRNTKKFFDNSNKIELSLDLFKNDALIFKNLNSNLITLKSTKNNKELTMDFTGFPYLAIWTKPTGAPFICIEPWYGHSDFADFKGDFKEKDGIEILTPGESFKASYNLLIK